MDTKLTLKLDKSVIDSAKDYASTHKTSLSKLVESYLRSLINPQESKDGDEIKISPFVKSMSKGPKLPLDLNYRKENIDRLSEKYK